jgi:hypothetical protein
VRRARRDGKRLFCNRRHAGLARRTHKTKAQKVEEKRIYDAEYRAINLASIKAKKHAHFKRTYDPKKAAVERHKKMHLHVEYCRRPEYRAYKSQYDRKHLAKKNYGAFAECALIARDLHAEVRARMSDYDVRTANLTLNKTQRRKRNHA